MLEYVRRSVERSPPMMREPGDASNFLRQLGGVQTQCRGGIAMMVFFVQLQLCTKMGRQCKMLFWVHVWFVCQASMPEKVAWTLGENKAS